MVNRDELIRYLLHQMPEDDRAAFLDRWSDDPELHEQLRMAESELFDAYAGGDLGPEERRRVEEYLLVSESQRQKLAFAEALRTSLSRRPRRRIVWPWLSAAAAVIVLAGMSFWFESRPSRPELRPSPGGLYAISVPTDELRGTPERHRLRLPNGTELVRLDFQFEPGEQAAAYSAAITQAGQTVWTEGPVRGILRGPAYLVPVWIPATALKAGTYEVRLTADGKLAAYYQFSIEP